MRFEKLSAKPAFTREELVNTTVTRLKARRDKNPTASLWQQNELTEYLHYYGRRVASALYDFGVRNRDEMLNQVHDVFKQAVPRNYT